MQTILNIKPEKSKASGYNNRGIRTIFVVLQDTCAMGEFINKE